MDGMLMFVNVGMRIVQIYTPQPNGPLATAALADIQNTVAGRGRQRRRHAGRTFKWPLRRQALSSLYFHIYY